MNSAQAWSFLSTMSSSRVRSFLSTLLAALCLWNGGLIAPARAATETLAGTTWRLVQFQDGHGQVLTADEGSSYTVEFRADDTVAVRVDCHRGRGTWVSRSASQLELGPLALTRATCPQTPLHAQIAKQWTGVRSYALRDAHLFLALGPNGGTYEFEPANAAAAVPTITASSTTAPTSSPPAATVPAATPPTPLAATAPAATPPTPLAATAPAASAPGAAQNARASWLDEPKPISWTIPGASIPRAPQAAGTADPRCRALARPPESAADKRLAEQGWDPIGAYQGGWGVLVLQGAASYDGMCRPQAYQEFVFVRGVFAGTLSPETMDSRAEGSLNRVTLQGDRRLVAEYARYARSDALCCPSRTTSVVFEIAADQAVVRPLSTATFANR
jgi:heat shock protein HslJ